MDSIGCLHVEGSDTLNAFTEAIKATVISLFLSMFCGAKFAQLIILSFADFSISAGRKFMPSR
jgi:hypothetical protein